MNTSKNSGLNVPYLEFQLKIKTAQVDEAIEYLRIFKEPCISPLSKDELDKRVVAIASEAIKRIQELEWEQEHED